jgi:FdhE protein
LKQPAAILVAGSFFVESMETKPITFNPPTEEAPSVLLPQIASLFSDRAARFSLLANEHSLAEWLHFLGLITQAQAVALQQLPDLALPPAEAIEQALAHGMPPLNASAIERPAAWHGALHTIIDTMLPEVPEVARSILTKLRAEPAERLEQLADILLKDTPGVASSGELPIVAAALQVVWTAMAAQLDASHLQPLDAHNSLPLLRQPCRGQHRPPGAERSTTCATCIVRCATPNGTCRAPPAPPAATDKEVALHQLKAKRTVTGRAA